MTNFRIIYDESSAPLAFAVAELRQTLAEFPSLQAEEDELEIWLQTDSRVTGQQAYAIRRTGPGMLQVLGSDVKGVMYGGLELAEALRLYRHIQHVPETEGSPFITRRGIQFDVPLDARTPGFNDTGDLAQENIAEMWDMGFWREFLDDMARQRWNVLSLWNKHPFPSLIKMQEYPEVALQDVCAPKDRETLRRIASTAAYDPAQLIVLKRLAIEEKIDFWRRVMEHAANRGIEVYMITWDLFAQRQDDPATIAYMRAAVRELLFTYPLLKGLGTIPGNNGEHRIEQFIWNTFGRGMMDVQQLQPGRAMAFIFRESRSHPERIRAAFKDYPGPVQTDATDMPARSSSTVTPSVFEQSLRTDGERYDIHCWLHVREDRLFYFRWGDPDAVRDYVNTLPYDVLAGILIGTEGSPGGREIISHHPQTPRQLEIRKHWYRFLMWGRLAYNPQLDRQFFERVLTDRFPDVAASTLYAAWKAASQVILLINTFHCCENAQGWAPEICGGSNGFHDVENFISNPVREGSDLLTIPGYLAAIRSGVAPEGTSPAEVARQIRETANQALAGIALLRGTQALPVELHETLTDIEALAVLGHYYAVKIEGALALAMFREDGQAEQRAEAVHKLEEAARHWRRYMRLASTVYKPQVLAGASTLDWRQIQRGVQRDLETAQTARPVTAVG